MKCSEQVEIHNQITEEDKIHYLPVFLVWWCSADVQKHQQPEPRESGRNPDYVS